LYEALLYAEGEDAVMYAEVANVVAAVLEGVLDKLDAVQLRTAITDEREGGAAAEDPS
jgi:hypothetical protein